MSVKGIIPRGKLKVSACTFLSCNGQAGTSATRAEARENNERDTVRPVSRRQRTESR